MCRHNFLRLSIAASTSVSLPFVAIRFLTSLLIFFILLLAFFFCLTNSVWHSIVFFQVYQQKYPPFSLDKMVTIQIYIEKIHVYIL